MILNLITIYLMMTAGLMIYLTAFIFFNGKAMYMKLVGVECILMAIYVSGYMLEINASDLQTALFWNGFEYLAIPFLSSVWLLIALACARSLKKVKVTLILLLFTIPIITWITRYTSRWQHLFYTSYTMNSIGEFHFIMLGKGVWYKVHSAFVIITSVVTFLILYRAYRTCKIDEKAKYRSITIATIIPIISEISIFTVTKRTGFDPMAFLLPIAAMLLVHTVVRYDFLDIKKLARDEMFEATFDGMLVLNNASKIVDYNQNAVKFFEENKIHLREAYLQELENAGENLGEKLMHTEEVIFEHKERNKSTYWSITTKKLWNRRNESYGQLKTIREVTSIIETKKRLEKDAMTDELSQLNNRHKFMKTGSKMIKKVLEKKIELTLIMLDIDFFKRVNDTFGHQVGDEVIKRLSKKLTQKFENKGYIFRIGGEEFTILIEDCSKERAFELAEDFRSYIEKSMFFKAQKYQITVSMGVAMFSQEDDLNTLLKKADIALYEAKKMGRNKVRVFEEES